MTSICRGEHCQASIDYATKPDGTGRMPVTRPGPCPGPGLRCTHDGTMAVWRSGPKLFYRMMTAGQLLGDREHRGVPHWAECPDADQFRPCKACDHRNHWGRVCVKLGKVECRRIAGAIVRGRFPCGCKQGVPDGG